jgi:hypothetical protein
VPDVRRGDFPDKLYRGEALEFFHGFQPGTLKEIQSVPIPANIAEPTPQI